VGNLGAAPVTTVAVVADLGVLLHTVPVGEGGVDLLLLGKQELELERLDGTHFLCGCVVCFH